MKVKSHTKNTDQEENKKENKNKKKKNEIKQQTENIKKSKESLCIPQRDPATLILQNRYLTRLRSPVSSSSSVSM